MLNGRGRARGSSGPSKTRKPRTEASEAAHEAYLERTYGVSPDRQKSLMNYQEGRCWGCPATGRARRLSLDHNHRTGEARMFLCNTCNNIVGHFRDDPERLIRLGLAMIDPPSRRAWLAAGRVRPGWSSNDQELLDLLAREAEEG